MEGEGLQLVGMSATMPNTRAVAKWLNVSEAPKHYPLAPCSLGHSASCLPFDSAC